MSQPPSPMRSLELEKIRGEARTQCRQHRRPAQTTAQRTLEDEQHRRSGHVSVGTQYLALVAQGSLLQLKRQFDSIEHFRAARMANKLRRYQSCAFDKPAHRRRHALL